MDCIGRSRWARRRFASRFRDAENDEAGCLGGDRSFDARRHARHHDIARHSAPHDPRYYARPVYYRPYPYGVPAPFVFGYGPFW
jgi:hypothetical protein